MQINKYFFAVMLLFAAQSLFAQLVLHGLVTDNGSEYLGNGAEPVIDALVTVTDQSDTSRTFSAYTNTNGEYVIEIIEAGIHDDPSAGPEEFRMLQNYPNPFNPSTTIIYELSKPSFITITVFDVTGRKIRTLVRKQADSGADCVVWDGTDNTGCGVPAGLYIYVLDAEGTRISRKMVLVDGMQNNGYGSDVVFPQPAPGATASTCTTKYTIQVNGIDIEPYEQKDIELASPAIINITVARTATDMDGNVYKTVKIGDQWWLAENLRVTHYRTGGKIPNITDATQWKQSDADKYCAYNNDQNYVETYGYLYNYGAFRYGLVGPMGWHVPNEEDWKELESFLGMKYEELNHTGLRGTDEGGKLKESGEMHWHLPNTGATNESGFCGFPGGSRNSCGTFRHVDGQAYFWSAPIHPKWKLFARYLNYDSGSIGRIMPSVNSGYSIRLIRDQ